MAGQVNIWARYNFWDHTTPEEVDRYDIYDDDEDATLSPVEFIPLGNGSLADKASFNTVPWSGSAALFYRFPVVRMFDSQRAYRSVRDVHPLHTVPKWPHGMGSTRYRPGSPHSI